MRKKMKTPAKMNVSRRRFLKTVGTGAAVVCASAAIGVPRRHAAQPPIRDSGIGPWRSRNVHGAVAGSFMLGNWRPKPSFSGTLGTLPLIRMVVFIHRCAFSPQGTVTRCGSYRCPDFHMLHMMAASARATLRRALGTASPSCSVQNLNLSAKGF